MSHPGKFSISTRLSVVGSTSTGMFWLLVLATVSGLVTTYSSQDVIRLVRLLAGAFVLLAVISAFARARYSRLVLISFGLYVVAFVYAIAVSVVTGGLEIAGSSMVLDFCVTTCAIVLFGTQYHRSSRVFSSKFVTWVSLYAIVGILMTYIFGGFALGFPPRFVFEVASDEIGREETYSLMLTGFFSIASIFSTVGVLRCGFGIRGSLYGVLTLLFVAFSFLAGGRGELLAGLFVILLALLSDRRFRIFAVLSLVVLAGFLMASNWVTVFDDLVVLKRFRVVFEGDYGYRDVLLGQVVDLLKNEPGCALLGCGPGYFQEYYGHDFGLYPHNHFAEALVIFGLPLVVLGLAAALRGGLLYYGKVGKLDLFLLVFIYSLLVSLKSGYFFGNWVLNAGILFFIGLCFQSGRCVAELGPARLSNDLSY